MKKHILIALIACMLPLLAVAQNRLASPMIIGEDEHKVAAPAAVPGAEFANFPENAITRIGENTMGEHVDAPMNPASPAAPTAPDAPAAAASPANPVVPAAPVGPPSKLWPRNTVETFVPSCTGLRPQYIKPCVCVITRLMAAMPHDEFIAKSEDGTIEQDMRLIRIRTDCVTAPTKKD